MKRITRTCEVKAGVRRTYVFKSKREIWMSLLLERLVLQGSVIKWWYEPHEFRCGRKYRKDRFYTPDFLAHLNPVHDVFDTGTKSVWIEVKDALNQDGKSRFHWLSQTYPFFHDIMLLMVDRNPRKGRNSKTAQRQIVLQDGACRWIKRVLYGADWYPIFGIQTKE